MQIGVKDKMKSFLIYFDESNKLDSPNKKYSYYGAYGGSLETMYKITKSVREIFSRLKTRSELHFSTYDSSEYVKKYFQVLNHVINKEIAMNILIVNNKDAAKSAEKMSIDIPNLRNLFYTKIPERLFYGLTRDLDNLQDVRIKVDDATEYRTLAVYEKLKEQMNAHSAYRNKSYSVSSVLGKNSKYSIPLQIVDTFMGIVVFLMEESYYNNSVSSKSKSDLIYRFLIENDNLIKFQQQITLFKWEGNEERMIQIPISEYISSFLAYKVQYDLLQLTKLQKIMIGESENSQSYNDKIRTYQQQIEFSNRERNTLLGYVSELETGDRNFYLRPFMSMLGMKKKVVKFEEKVYKIYQFKAVDGTKYRNGFLLGSKLKIKNNGKAQIEVKSGRIEYEYEINSGKIKDFIFQMTLSAEEYWKDRVETNCGNVKIYLDNELIVNKDVNSLQAPFDLILETKGARNFRIEATGQMVGLINPVFLKENTAKD